MCALNAEILNGSLENENLAELQIKENKRQSPYIFSAYYKHDFLVNIFFFFL